MSEKMRRAKPMLGTIVEISVCGTNREHLVEAVSAAFESIEKVQKLMSFHDESSEISRLNARARFEPQVVHSWTYAVLAFSKELGTDSNGYFDITAARSVDVYDLQLCLSKAYSSSNQSSFRDIDLLTENQIFFKRPIKLDLGGVAKGFAVDRAIDVLRAHHVESAIVNAGGDIRVFGECAVPIHIRSPQNPIEILKAFELQDGAVATSANYFAPGPGSVGIADPLTSRSWNKCSSVTVVASECMVADALTKVMALCGNAASKLLDRYNAQALIISAEQNSNLGFEAVGHNLMMP